MPISKASVIKMAVILNSLALGDSNSGKTSFLTQLCSGRRCLHLHEASVYDSQSHTQFVFKIEELTQPPDSFVGVSCCLLFYDMTNYRSFVAIKDHWLPLAVQKGCRDSGFIIILGTHSDLRADLAIETQTIENLAAEQGVIFMEVSAVTRKNVDLTLKLMRIRARQLLTHYPKLREVPVETESPKPVSRALELEFEDEEVQADHTPTPQFSERHKFTEGKLEALFTSDMPRPMADFKKRNRYEDDLDHNMSFANMSSITNREDSGFFQDDIECNVLTGDTLGSPSCQMPLRRVMSTSNTSAKAVEEATVLFDIEVRLGPKKAKKISVKANDTALGLAEQVLSGYSVKSELVDLLASQISERIRNYCDEIRNNSLEKENVPRPLLFKLHVNIGDRKVALEVRDGDSIKATCEEFCRRHQLNQEVQRSLLSSLLSAAARVQGARA
mmetsp:Transcript_602/g.1012  ORF Transcript_602/g.1012 Transcript_602/m.1012 type:complete len:444 (+) Transcript_602:4846-6177(+)